MPKPDHAPPKKPVLIVLHQEHSTPGRVGMMLEQRGYRLDIRKPRFDEPLPCTTGDHAAAVFFGGPMSANDPDDYIRREIDWFGLALRDNLPVLGICLGAQMLARHLGAPVSTHPERVAEIGYYPIRPTDLSAALPWPSHVYQWHREGFDHPPGSHLLATGDTFENQAFCCGNRAVGLQFHPEVTYRMMCRWTVRGHERLVLPGAQPRESHLQGWMMYDRSVAHWLSAFLDHWLGNGLPLDSACPKSATGLLKKSA